MHFHVDNHVRITLIVTALPSQSHAYTCSSSCLLGCDGEERGREQGPAAENWPTAGNKL